MTAYSKSFMGLPNSLRLWDPMHTNTAIIDTKTIDYFPQSSLESSDSINFTIPAMEKLMLDKIHVIVDLKVMSADKVTNLAANTNVSFVPHLAAALWRNVEFSIGGTSLTQSFDNSYAMNTFWNTVLHTPKTGHLLKRLTEGLHLDDVTTKAASESLIFFGNEGVINQHAKHRAERISQSKTVSLISELNVSLLKQDKLLPPRTEYQINFTKNYDEFILLEAANGTSKVVFEKVILRCTFQQPCNMVLNIFEEDLAKENAIYHADKYMLTFHSLMNTVDHTIDIFNGPLPYHILIGVQDRSALARNGRNKNPFSLHPIKQVQLFVNGKDHFPIPITRTSSEYGIMYDSFLRECGNPHNGDTMLHDHYRAFPAMAFDLTPNRNANTTSLNISKHGNCRLNFTLFDAANNYVLMVLAIYEQAVEFDKDRQVTLG